MAPSDASAAPALAKAARVLYSQQIARLNEKSTNDNAVLDHSRELLRKYCEIEKEAAERKERLCKSYAKLHVQLSATGTAKSPAAQKADEDGSSSATDATAATPDVDGGASRPALHAFGTMVRTFDTAAKNTLQMCAAVHENLDPVREFVAAKASDTAKSIESWRTTTDAVTSELLILADRRSKYEEAAKAADHATKKHADLLAGKTSMIKSVKAAFSSSTDEERLDKAAAKLTAAKRELVISRNAYLLSLASSNAAQSSYWETHLPDFLCRLDGDFHPTLAKLFASMTNRLDENARNALAGIETIAKEALRIDRDVEQAAFLARNAKFFPGATIFAHDAPVGDQEATTTRVQVVDDIARTELSTLLADLMKRRQMTSKEHEKALRELAGLAKMAEVYEKTPNFGDAATSKDTMLTLSLQVSAFSVQLAAIEAQISALEQAGISITQGITMISVVSTTEGLADLVASSSRPQVVKRSFTASSIADLKSALVLYDYDAQEPNEVSMREGDTLTVLEPDQDGWTKVTTNGKTGFVPSNYIKVSAAPPPPKTAPPPMEAPATISRPLSRAGATMVTALFDHHAAQAQELSFAAGDEIRVLDTRPDGSSPTGPAADWWKGTNARTGETGLFPYVFTQNWEAALSDASPTPPVPPIPTTMPTSPRTGRVRSTSRSTTPRSRPMSTVSALSGDTAQQHVTAIFDYAAGVAGELNMAVGDSIAVLSTRTGSDAWWEGRNLRTGEVGQFPKDYCC
ncbi:hypothetical protein BC828DRAFT_388901 [Blastocladiella britannica]|nr:hypothetical protein BC828DRAFT_388901 [Blastocladiella britannica]